MEVEFGGKYGELHAPAYIWVFSSAEKRYRVNKFI